MRIHLIINKLQKVIDIMVNKSKYLFIKDIHP